MNGARWGRFLSDRILESPITWLITAINLGVFTIAWLQGEHRADSLTGATLRAYGALDRYLVWSGDYWRLMTAVFLHVGWIHLIWNVGHVRVVREHRAVGGSAWFAFAYVTTGHGARHRGVIGHPAFRSGASGAGFSMIGVIPRSSIGARAAGSPSGRTATRTCWRTRASG
jgi:rhomboid protease GluP